MIPAMSRLRLSEIHSRLPLGRLGGGTVCLPFWVVSFWAVFGFFLLALVLLLDGVLTGCFLLFLVDLLGGLLLGMQFHPVSSDYAEDYSTKDLLHPSGEKGEEDAVQFFYKGILLCLKLSFLALQLRLLPSTVGSRRRL